MAMSQEAYNRKQLKNRKKLRKNLYYNCTTWEMARQLDVPLWKAMEFGKYFKKKGKTVKFSLEEIYQEIDFEDKWGVNTLLQDLFASEFSETGMDVIMDKENEVRIIKGTTIKVSKGKLTK